MKVSLFPESFWPIFPVSVVAILVGPLLRGCVQRRQCCPVLVVVWWWGDTAQWPRLTGKFAVERGTSWLSFSFFCVLCTHPHIPLEWLSRFPNTQAPWLSSCSRHLWEASPSPWGNTAGGVCLVQLSGLFPERARALKIKSTYLKSSVLFFSPSWPTYIFILFISRFQENSSIDFWKSLR